MGTIVRAGGEGGGPANRGVLRDRHHFFSELLNKPVKTEASPEAVGRVSDLVFRLTEPYPEAVGIYMRYGWGRKPPQLVPWERLRSIESEEILIETPAGGEPSVLFVDQPGWILVEEHLMGRTILEIDGRRTRVVNDVQLLQVDGGMLLVQVDCSINGLLRRWGLQRLSWQPDELIPWKLVQPFSLEDALGRGNLRLAVTREELKDLPREDLADALGQLTRPQQEAVFAALDSEKAAEALVEAEPRAQRQLVGLLLEMHVASAEWKERARRILHQMTVAQLAALMPGLSHDDSDELLRVLPQEMEKRMRRILAKEQLTAEDLISPDFLTVSTGARAGDVLARVRGSGLQERDISYVFALGEDGRLEGVVDLRALILAADSTLVSTIMHSPVVTVEANDSRVDLAERFSRYHYRMLPLVDADNRLVGVIRYDDIMRGGAARSKA